MGTCQFYNTYSMDDTETTFLPISTLTFSTIGMILSTIALVMLILTATLFSEWRRNYKNQLLTQFMIARFFYTFVRYFCDITILFEIDIHCSCPLTLGSVTKIYTEMVLLSWMFLFSKQMYECFVRVFAVKKPNVLKLSLCGWLLPAIATIILCFCVAILNSWHFHFFFFYVIALKWPILCSNGFFLIVVLKSILGANKSKTESNTRIIIVMIILIFSFCFQQAFYDIYKLINFVNNFKKTENYIPVVFTFTDIISVYHCAFSIMFWLFANKETRILWGMIKDKSLTIYRVDQHNKIDRCYTIT